MHSADAKRSISIRLCRYSRDSGRPFEVNAVYGNGEGRPVIQEASLFAGRLFKRPAGARTSTA
jgi:hypothetical protein